MDLKEIKEVIKLMKSNDITNFELEKDGFKIVLKKEQQIITQRITEPAPAYYTPQPIQNMAAQSATQQIFPQQVAGSTSLPEAEDPNIDYITSPMVGTFYAAPSPESPPYVTSGHEIKLDDIVCIVEAMKVFNEIKAEISGKIVEVMVENGASVEYGQKMFKVKKI